MGEVREEKKTEDLLLFSLDLTSLLSNLVQKNEAFSVPVEWKLWQMITERWEKYLPLVW